MVINDLDEDLDAASPGVRETVLDQVDHDLLEPLLVRCHTGIIKLAPEFRDDVELETLAASLNVEELVDLTEHCHDAEFIVVKLKAALLDVMSFK